MTAIKTYFTKDITLWAMIDTKGVLLVLNSLEYRKRTLEKDKPDTWPINPATQLLYDNFDDLTQPDGAIYPFYFERIGLNKGWIMPKSYSEILITNNCISLTI